MTMENAALNATMLATMPALIGMRVEVASVLFTERFINRTHHGGMTLQDIGENLRGIRAGRGISLSELARLAGVSKSSLSELEAGKRNPTIETLYALCAPLNVPITAILGETPGVDAATDAGVRTILLSVRHLPDRTVEVFRVEFPAAGGHTSPGHGPGVLEHLMVIEGALGVGPVGAESVVHAGESASWSSAAAHKYRVIAGPGEGVLVITTPR